MAAILNRETIIVFFIIFSTFSAGCLEAGESAEESIIDIAEQIKEMGLIK